MVKSCSFVISRKSGMLDVGGMLHEEADYLQGEALAVLVIVHDGVVLGHVLAVLHLHERQLAGQEARGRGGFGGVEHEHLQRQDVLGDLLRR